MSDESYLRELPDRTEVRNRPGVVEVRQDDDGGMAEVEGHAATFNDTYSVGPFEERIAEGAFDGVLDNDVLALVNHDVNRVMARSGSEGRPLELSVDEVGLRSRFPIPDHAEDVRKDLEDGVLRDMSFAFTVGEDTWEKTEDGTDLRTIESVDRLFDVSIVAQPANPNTDVALRSLEAAREDNTTDTTTDSSGADAILRVTDLSTLDISAAAIVGEARNEDAEDEEDTSGTDIHERRVRAVEATL